MKFSKITLALFSAGVLVSGHAFALTDITETDGTANSSYSTAIGNDSVAGNGLTWGQTGATTYGTSVAEDGTTQYNTNTNTGNVAIGNNAEAGTGSDTDKSGLSHGSVSRSDGTQYKESEHGGINTGTDYKYGHGSSTAIGNDSYADWGGTAIGQAATASGRDSVGIGKEVSVTGHKAVGIGEDTVSSGYRSTAVGNSSEASAKWSTALGAEAVADELDALAVGRAASANAEGGVAIGNNSSVTGENSVALGAGSVASRANTVSVGDVGSERTISNVADGIYATDAVNLRQLENVEKKLSSGIAAAMAFTVPQFAPGKSNAIAMGAAHYNGASAMSLNLAHKFTEEIIGTAGVAKGFNSASTSRGSSDDIGIKASVSWSF